MSTDKINESPFQCLAPTPWVENVCTENDFFQPSETNLCMPEDGYDASPSYSLSNNPSNFRYPSYWDESAAACFQQIPVVMMGNFFGILGFGLVNKVEGKVHNKENTPLRDGEKVYRVEIFSSDGTRIGIEVRASSRERGATHIARSWGLLYDPYSHRMTRVTVRQLADKSFLAFLGASTPLARFKLEATGNFREPIALASDQPEVYSKDFQLLTPHLPLTPSQIEFEGNNIRLTFLQGDSIVFQSKRDSVGNIIISNARFSHLNEQTTLNIKNRFSHLSGTFTLYDEKHSVEIPFQLLNQAQLGNQVDLSGIKIKVNSSQTKLISSFEIPWVTSYKHLTTAILEEEGVRKYIQMYEIQLSDQSYLILTTEGESRLKPRSVEYYQKFGVQSPQRGNFEVYKNDYRFGVVTIVGVLSLKISFAGLVQLHIGNNANEIHHLNERLLYYRGEEASLTQRGFSAFYNMLFREPNREIDFENLIKVLNSRDLSQAIPSGSSLDNFLNFLGFSADKRSVQMEELVRQIVIALQQLDHRSKLLIEMNIAHKAFERCNDSFLFEREAAFHLYLVARYAENLTRPSIEAPLNLPAIISEFFRSDPSDGDRSEKALITALREGSKKLEKDLDQENKENKKEEKRGI